MSAAYIFFSSQNSIIIIYIPDLHVSIFFPGGGAYGGTPGDGAHGPEASVPDSVPEVHHDPVRTPGESRHRREGSPHPLVQGHPRPAATGVPACEYRLTYSRHEMVPHTEVKIFRMNQPV